MNDFFENDKVEASKKREARYLKPNQVQMIDEALASLGEFGELRLIVEKGRLRYIVTQKSYDALKWHPGYFGQDIG